MPNSFGLLLERIEKCQQETGKWSKRWSLVEITSAIRGDLRVRVAYYGGGRIVGMSKITYSMKQPKIFLSSLRFKLKPLEQIESILLLALTF